MINGPSLILTELVNNLSIMKSAFVQLKDHNFTINLRLFIERLFASKRRAPPDNRSIDDKACVHFGKRLMLSSDDTIMKILNAEKLMYRSIHKTCWMKNVRFSVYDANTVAKHCDSCVLLKKQEPDFICGFILAIITTSKNQCQFIIHTVEVDHHDRINIKKRTVVNPFIFWGRLTNPPRIKIVCIDGVLTKLAYRRESTVFHFFHFPNTVEST